MKPNSFNSNFETEDKFPLKNIITVIGVHIHDIDNKKKFCHLVENNFS